MDPQQQQRAAYDILLSTDVCPYEALGFARAAAQSLTKSAVLKKFKALALIVHPDKAPQGEKDRATEAFKALQKAKDVLVKRIERGEGPPRRRGGGGSRSGKPSQADRGKSSASGRSKTRSYESSSSSSSSSGWFSDEDDFFAGGFHDDDFFFFTSGFSSGPSPRRPRHSARRSGHHHHHHRDSYTYAYTDDHHADQGPQAWRRGRMFRSSRPPNFAAEDGSGSGKHRRHPAPPTFRTAAADPTKDGGADGGGSGGIFGDAAPPRFDRQNASQQHQKKQQDAPAGGGPANDDGGSSFRSPPRSRTARGGGRRGGTSKRRSGFHSRNSWVPPKRPPNTADDGADHQDEPGAAPDFGPPPEPRFRPSSETARSDEKAARAEFDAASTSAGKTGTFFYRDVASDASFTGYQWKDAAGRAAWKDDVAGKRVPQFHHHGPEFGAGASAETTQQPLPTFASSGTAPRRGGFGPGGNAFNSGQQQQQQQQFASGFASSNYSFNFGSGDRSRGQRFSSASNRNGGHAAPNGDNHDDEAVGTGSAGDHKTGPPRFHNQKKSEGDHGVAGPFSSPFGGLSGDGGTRGMFA